MKQLSIVLPAYNEASRLGACLEEVLAFCRREYDHWEVLVVDDGSTDATARIARSFEEVRLLRNGVNLGKGESVRRGMLAARLDPILFSDVDLSTPIEEALALLRAIESSDEIAIASRVGEGKKEVQRTPARFLMAAVFRGIVKLLVLRGVRDTQCGFKMFPRDAAQRIFACQQLDGWAFDVEILFLAKRFGYRIVEVPVSWHEAEESRLTLWSPLQMFADLLRIRWYALTGRYAQPDRRQATASQGGERPGGGHGASGRS